jgi:hypothetical protein
MNYLQIPSIAGLLLETVGIYLFTKDVLSAVAESMQRIEEVAANRSVEFTGDALVLSEDGPLGAGCLSIEGARLAIPDERRAVPLLLRKRKALITGAAFLAAGIIVQLAGSLWQLFSPA